MILKQYYLGCLAHASYLVADEGSGIAAVVDPQRDVDAYIEDAHRLGCRIAHAFLTHFHADFIAGHLELRDREGARIYLGARAQAEYDFTPLADEDDVTFGHVRLKVIETPGHSPESISILVYDLESDQRGPHAVLTGDTLFIGDVGRPDLRASTGWSADQLGGMLYDSLHFKLMALPDDTLVYPAHGAGSLCGKNLSTDTVSTIGTQRRYNYALQPMSREQFVRVVTAEQAEPPPYFSYDAVLNTRERPTLEHALAHELWPLALAEAEALIAEGAVVLDTRDPADFAGAHLAGSVNIGLGGSYATWAGTILDRERPLVVIADLGRETEAAMRLGRIGFDNVAGFLDGGMQSIDPRPGLLARIERVTAVALAEQLADSDPPLVLDVRAEHDWRQSRVGGSLNIPLGQLLRRLDEIPGGRALVVYCQSGYRSSIAASLLLREGRARVADLVGGINAWQASGANGQHAAGPVVKERPRAAPPAAGKDPRLVIWSEQPLNAETPLELLSGSQLTANELFFVRNHGPVPEVDPAGYRLAVRGLVGDPLTLSLDELRQRFEHVTVEAALACAGNRRSELATVAAIPGQAPWGPGAVGNARWGGIRLRDIVQAAGLETGAAHVAFTGLDRCSEEGEVTSFGGSIPLTKALAPEVLLADEMNGKPLAPAHGYPLRVIVPGYIGARSVKWLATITVQNQPSTNYFQARTYRLYPSRVRSEATRERGFSLGETPVNSVICHPRQGAVIDGARVIARGYALTGGSREIERVEITLDSGASFTTARLIDGHGAGAWRLWETELALDPGVHDLAVRAWDSAASTQPERPEGIWNLKGYLNNCWHAVRFTVTKQLTPVTTPSEEKPEPTRSPAPARERHATARWIVDRSARKPGAPGQGATIDERIGVVVIGAGQAGLAVSHELTTLGVEHVVLERGRVGQTWRDRWDSFCLVTPNWSVQLPGGAYSGDDPDGFMPRDEIVRHLDRYAGSFAAPVREGVEVTSLAAAPGRGFALTTGDRVLLAEQVVLTTGAYQRAHRPPGASTLPSGILQIDAEGYSNEPALPPGKVLVVGSGQTGCQLAEELREAGREVVLACGRAPWCSRRIGDRDVVYWAIQTGSFDETLADLPSPSARLVSNIQATGHGGGHDLHYRVLQQIGVTLVGHFLGAHGGRAHFASDLAASVAFGDARYNDTRGKIAKLCSARGIPTPHMPDPPPFDADAPEAIDLAGFDAVIFTSGFRPDYSSWVHFDAFDEIGFPIHEDGASDVVPGLYFCGVHFLRKRKSSLLVGVGEDATLVAGKIAARGAIPITV